VAPNPTLNRKVALITGAGQGIGLATAYALADAGCHVVITARTASRLNQAAKKLARRKVRVLAAPCDVRDPRQVKMLFTQVKKQFGRLDFLINNAGVGHAAHNVAKLPLEIWKEVLDTNLTGTFLITQAALPLMKNSGAIVNNLSIAAKRVWPGTSAYNASKHGALGFTNTLREELRPRGIRVIALLPGATDTAIWNTLWPEAPRKKMIAPSSIARAVVDALSLPADSTLEELTILPKSGTL
jgi:NAD(P)-dependent dehydrogenase (short-subunit alcohol dehydrogenase family)